MRFSVKPVFVTKPFPISGSPFPWLADNCPFLFVIIFNFLFAGSEENELSDALSKNK